MRTVYQDEEANDCGPASLAMLADITIEDAKKALFGSDTHSKKVGRAKILQALRSFGFRPKTKRPVRLSSFECLSNVEGRALVYGRADKAHHWMVWDGKEKALRDPLAFTLSIKATSFTELDFENR